MNKTNIATLILGIILIFSSLYIFTQPAIFQGWDFSSTGQIGDTIGGIAGPIINFVGALLVYFSFQTQIRANQIQSDALSDEKNRLNADSIFQKQLSQLNDIKLCLKDLEFIVQFPHLYSGDGTWTANPPIIFRGLNALHEYTRRISKPQQFSNERYETYGMFLNFQFMLLSIDDLVKNVDTKINDQNDKEYILNNAKHFYISFLKSFVDIVIKVKLPDDPNKSELMKINQSIKSRFDIRKVH